jgi:hypothetical protein
MKPATLEPMKMSLHHTPTSPRATAESKGYTKHVLLMSGVGGCYDLELLVKPDADLDSRFSAFDLDTGEMLTVNGWLFSTEEA